MKTIAKLNLSDRQQFKPGDSVCYDDGRLVVATATVIDVDPFGMLVQFEARAALARAKGQSV